MVDHLPYLDAWRTRRALQARRDAALAAQARAVTDRLVLQLRDEFGAARVVLIGSLARGEFHEGSDIDLVVAGLAPDQLFRCGADLANTAGPFKVDVIPMESANARLLAALTVEGVVLHDQV